ncbi:hypothetical protein V8E51_004280 [Hyaloscypha variabilis]
MATDSLTGNLRLEVNYQKKYSDIYVEDRPLGGRHENLPSWVPNWTSSKDRNVFDFPDFDTNQTRLPATILLQLSQNSKLQIKCEGSILARVQILGNKTLDFGGLTRKDTGNAWSGEANSAGDFKNLAKGTLH